MKNGIIVPTHPKDFHWTYQLLDSASDEEEIIVIFSCEEDYLKFERVCKFLIAPKKPDYIESNPTYKKLYALSKLYKDYEYLATIDTECIFLKPTTPYLEEIWNGNCFIANKSIEGNRFIESCLEDLGIANYPYETNLYFWFNEIQIYPCSLIPQFLAWIFGKDIHKNSFDYLMFGIFMIMEKGQKLKILDCGEENIKDGVIEDMNLYVNCRDLVKEVNWSSWFMGIQEFDNIKMLLHLDRYAIE
jgi:hypothetical protein